MLKRFLKGLGIASACLYALASPQNTIYLTQAEETNEYITTIDNLKIRDTRVSNNTKQYLYKINILFGDNNYVYSNFSDDTNDFDIDFTNNSQLTDNNYFLTLYIASYYTESGFYMITRAYFNKLGYDEINNVFFISQTIRATDVNYNSTYYLDYTQDITSFYIEYKNAYIVIEDVIENNVNYSYTDFTNYINNDNKKALEPLLLKTTNIYNIINNLQSQAYNNGKMSGYDEGYNDGYNSGIIDNTAYQNGYNDGYDVGIGDNIIPKNIIGWFRILGRGIQSVLDIEILPYMKVGYIIGIPILFGLILFIVRLVRGD